MTRRALLGAAVIDQGGAPPPPPPPPPGNPLTDPLRSYLIYDALTLHAAPNQVAAHYFAPHQLSDRELLNTGPLNGDGTRQDGYDTGYLKPPDYGTDTSDPTSNAWGGYWRNRPLKPTVDLGGNWRALQHQTQIQQALLAGLDGFYVECISQPGAIWDQNQRDCFVQVANLGLVGSFWCVPMFDCGGNYGPSRSVANFTADIGIYAAFPAARHVNGKLQVAIYHPELRPPADWTALRTACANAGYPIELTFCYVISLTTALSQGYGPVADRHGRWGDRDPTTTGQNNATNRLMAANLRTRPNDYPCLGYVAPSDCRPDGTLYWEYNGTAQYRTSWDSVINGAKPAGVSVTPPSGTAGNPAAGYQGGGPGDTVPGVGSSWMCQRASGLVQPDYVQIPTYNDYSEDAVTEPSRNFGWFFADMAQYYLTAYKLGFYPDIVSDCIWLSHRTEFTGGKLGAGVSIGAQQSTLDPTILNNSLNPPSTLPAATRTTFPFTWSIGTGSTGEQVTATSLTGTGTGADPYIVHHTAATKSHAKGAYIGPMTYTYQAMTTPQRLSGNTPGVDVIEAYVHVAGPRTLTLTAGVTPTDMLYPLTSAGVWVLTRPLLAGPAGSISAKLTDGNGAVTQQITSPWAVSHTQKVMDKPLRGGTSRRGWSSQYPYPVPTQTTTIT